MASSCRVTPVQTNPFLLDAKLGGVALAVGHVSPSSLSRAGSVSICQYFLDPIHFSVHFSPRSGPACKPEAGFVQLYSGGCGGLECKAAVIALEQKWRLGMQG